MSVTFLTVGIIGQPDPHSVLSDMVALAEKTNMPVRCNYTGLTIFAQPGDTVESLIEHCKAAFLDPKSNKTVVTRE